MKWGWVFGLCLAFATHCEYAGSMPDPYAPASMPINMAALALADEPDYAHAKLATMRLETSAHVCSGTAVDHHVVLTAKHCLADGLEGWHMGLRTAVITHVEEDAGDAVKLTTDLYFQDIAPMATGKPRQGDIVFSYGNPASTPDILLVGRVAGWVAHYDGQDNVMLLDRNDWYGCSGAAVFNHDGQIVGIVNAIYPWPNQGWRLSAVFPLSFGTQKAAMENLARDLAEMQREYERAVR